jgi:isoleucyl-tRNA synthetase
MSDENNYSIWSFLKKCHEREFIYKGLDSMPWCPRCGTGISEQERREGYKLIEDDSVYVRLPLRGRDQEYLLIWTTTPWTLAANVAAAVAPEIGYVKAKHDGATYYLAENRLAGVWLDGQVEVLETLPGSQMVGWEYDGPFDDLPGAAQALPVHKVIPWEEVSEAEGTGVVHIAPGCGKEDFELGKEFGLPVIVAIDESGIYGKGFGFLTGRYASDVTQDIYEDLKTKDLFVRSERYVHDYPHCWRCGTQLLFRAVDEWFINMSWRDEIKSLVPQIRWIPDYGEAQEIDWLNNMGDWMISKKRYWGLALPIWECSSCGAFDVIGSREELAERAVEGWIQFDGHTPHRPWVDSVKIACRQCGEKTSRIPDVGNPWLDAGIVPYSTVYYNTNQEEWSKWIPADFIVENLPGQFRNWFYSLLAMSAMMERIPPSKNVLAYASVRDEHGDDMHKSKGNAIDFHDAASRVSVDSLRWLFCRQVPTSNINFSFAMPEQIQRKVFGTLWNTYAFLVNYARLDRFDPSAPKIPAVERPEIDRWILSNLQLLIRSAHQNFRDYWISPFVRQAEEFIDELSNWYVRRNRRRFWRGRSKDDRDKMAAYQTLYEVLTALIKVLAPVIPFLAERLHQNLRTDGEAESIHHCDFPEVDESLIDNELSATMALAQETVALGHSLREKARIRVRQPLLELRVAAEGGASRFGRLTQHIAEELNVKRVEWTDLSDLPISDEGLQLAEAGPLKVALDTRITPELKREGLARDFVRRIQQLRRDSGLNIEDRIEISYDTGDVELARAIEEWSDYIRAETLADSLGQGSLDGHAAELRLGEAWIKLWLRRR